jgi:hypothetical protein
VRYRAPGALLAACLAQATAAPAAEPAPHSSWSGNHAQTIARGRVELGLLQSSHYGLSDRVEVSLHPLLFFALPHVELKALAVAHGALSLAARGRLAYPTLFLGLVSREGAGGLLPSSSEPPQALQIEGDLLGTVAWADQQLGSVRLGLAVAPHAAFEPEQLPLLDFPFLYPRFAPLYTVLVPRAGLAFEGRAIGPLFYDLELSAYLMPQLPDVGTAWALEQALALEYRFGDRLALSLGLRTSEAKYAYGSRFHFLPYADVRVGF